MRGGGEERKEGMGGGTLMERGERNVSQELERGVGEAREKGDRKGGLRYGRGVKQSDGMIGVDMGGT